MPVPLAVRVTLLQPGLVPEIDNVGLGFTVMACEAVAVHDPSVEVTVYVPVDVKVLVALVVEFPPDHT